MLTYVFPGQGSQFKGMGADLLSDFKTLTARASEVLGYSIEELCIRDPKNQISQTQYTQPAIYVISALSYLKHYEETNRKSDFLAGHSLGEYNALFAAGVFDFETGLRLVKKRGELMSQSRSGAMAAVLGLTATDVGNILADNNFDLIDIANFNSPSQIVLSGDSTQIKNASVTFEKHNARYITLPVSAAFHSRYMEEAKASFAEFLNGFEFKPAKIPVISNVTARPYLADLEKKHLCDQITHSVRWTETVEYLIEQGSMEFKELGPGNVLTKLVDFIQSNKVSDKAA
jgi:malonyl CoA-acyl carrier protein transacylase